MPIKMNDLQILTQTKLTASIMSRNVNEQKTALVRSANMRNSSAERLKKSNDEKKQIADAGKNRREGMLNNAAEMRMIADVQVDGNESFRIFTLQVYELQHIINS